MQFQEHKHVKLKTLDKVWEEDFSPKLTHLTVNEAETAVLMHVNLTHCQHIYRL
jgi:hypothetical protein